MPNFIGFNTIGQDKKFTLTDFDLIKRDLLNAFSIREGTMPGRPDVGTKIWEYLYDPNDAIIERQIEEEVTRIIGSDTRLELQKISVFQDQNVVSVESTVLVLIDSSIENLFLTFDAETQTATIS